MILFLLFTQFCKKVLACTSAGLLVKTFIHRVNFTFSPINNTYLNKLVANFLSNFSDFSTPWITILGSMAIVQVRHFSKLKP